MLRSLFPSGGNREYRPFGVMREAPALHFYMMQAVGFTYLFYRFASRNYTVFGFLPDEAFTFGRASAVQLVPVPWVHWTTFQFIYDFLPRPGPEGVLAMQVVVLVACFLGAVGVVPRVCAIVAFVVATHVTGMMITTSADVDGGSLVLCTMLILAISPSRSFYSWRNGFVPLRRSLDYHWPIVLLFMTVGAFYTFSGINKVIDIGPHWPFVLHLDNLAGRGVEQSIFLFNDRRNALFASWSGSYALSTLGGFVTLVGEAGFLSVLFLPRFRLFFVTSMISLHVLVYLLAGINFIGSSAILLLCFDWNVLAREATVVYDGSCGFCKRSIAKVRRWDSFRRLTFVPAQQLPSGSRLSPALLNDSMGLEDENGEVYYGADAFEQVGARCPLLWPYAVAMKIPGAIYLARHAYARIAANRAFRLAEPTSDEQPACDHPGSLGSDRHRVDRNVDPD